MSKKFVAAVIASLASFLSLHFGWTEAQVALVTGPLWLYIGGQAVADVGKSRAIIENPPQPEENAGHDPDFLKLVELLQAGKVKPVPQQPPEGSQ